MLTPIEKMRGEDEEDTRLLREMAERARDYVTSFPWCPPIRETYLAYGIGKVIALFLFEFEGKIDGTYHNTWIIVGDLPPCFFAVQPDDTVQLLFDDYCDRMDDWVAAVRNNGNFEKVFPVSAARTEKHADMLESRLAFLRKEIIPEAPADLMTDASGEIIVS
jgi:hypothetical protein